MYDPNSKLAGKWRAQLNIYICYKLKYIFITIIVILIHDLSLGL
jgi:hypothetical protein